MYCTNLLASLSPLLLRTRHLAVFTMASSLLFCCTRLSALCLSRSSLSRTALWERASCCRRDSSLRCCCWTMWLRWPTVFPDTAASRETWLRSFPLMSASLETRPLWKQSCIEWHYNVPSGESLIWQHHFVSPYPHLGVINSNQSCTIGLLVK